MAKEQYVSLYKQYSKTIKKHCSELLNKFRDEAFESLCNSDFYVHSEEKNAINLQPAYDSDFGLNFNRVDINADPYKIFRCDVPNINSYLCFVVNDKYYQNTDQKVKLPNGVVVSSLNTISETNPDLVIPYLFKNMDWKNNPTQAFNVTFAQDGLFIYVPKNTEMEMPIQVVNFMYGNSDIMAVSHNVIVLEEGAKLKLLVCDHTSNDSQYLANRVTEIFVGKNASYEHYKVENTHNKMTNISNVLVNQGDNSKLLTNLITLHNGYTQNNIKIDVNGENSETVICGLAIGDKQQTINNYTLIDHARPKSNSQQMFKYILDDQSKGTFTGKILVQKQSQKTVAFQTCRTILLSKDAHIKAKPQLEIYADDVKCSHGNTIGQLDDTAMFYLRSRGISEKEAKLLLMYAFVHDVLENITVEALKDRVKMLVEKRLRGDLSKCSGCIICK